VGAHGLRDLRSVYEFDPEGQVWARSMVDLLIHANAAAAAARATGHSSLSDAALAEISAWYRGAVAKGITDNQHKRSRPAKDGRRLARRFRDHQDMILRFTTDLAVSYSPTAHGYQPPSDPAKWLPAPTRHTSADPRPLIAHPSPTQAEQLQIRDQARVHVRHRYAPLTSAHPPAGCPTGR
jgi:hypothetical protein